MEGLRDGYKYRMKLISPYTKNKVVPLQRIFQAPDGLPVFLKGKHDVKIYRGAMGFSVIGLAVVFFSIYQMATGQLVKKEA
jgi:hypothetical protein